MSAWHTLFLLLVLALGIVLLLHDRL